tara:strand:- start:7642 stop:7914 length:273 start_codon:yes stop_codon:yes gene_type:complete
MHAHPPTIRTGRLSHGDGECAVKVMVRNIELARYGADVFDSAVIDARFYRPDGLLDQKLCFDSLQHTPKMLNLEQGVCPQLIWGAIFNPR